MMSKAATTSIMFLALWASASAFQIPTPRARHATPSFLSNSLPPRFSRLAMAESDNDEEKSTRTLGQRVRNLFRRGQQAEEAVEETSAVATVQEDANEVTSKIEYMDAVELPKEEDEKEDEKDLMQKIKDAGKAGFISYALWEWAFWLFSVPIAVGGFYQLAGHWPDFSDQDDLAKVGAEAFAFVNFARFAVPLRIGLAFSTVGWVQENIVDRFFPEDDSEKDESK